MSYAFIHDKYSTIRGGRSRVLQICCEHCGAHVTYYQKDGPGILKRMYVDRFIDLKPIGADLSCSQCERNLGVLFIYQKEKRHAYRLFVGSVIKKPVNSRTLDH